MTEDISWQDQQQQEGLKPTVYIVGDIAEDGHDHVFYLRDHLPLATTTETSEGVQTAHAHSITKGPGDTFVCNYVAGHTHTTFVVKEQGDYALLSIFTEE